MLEGLSQIPWSSIQDAYGWAGKAPRYIRDLVSPDEGTRLEAYNYLHDSLLYCGFVYEATFYALPFLL
jgi:hypothetical protein